MRIGYSLVVALGAASLLAACGPTNATRQVSSTPPVVTSPSVTYAVAGNDLSQANANAIAYCRQYNMGVVMQGVSQRGSENVATYACSGNVAIGAVNTVAAPMVAAPTGPVVVAPSPVYVQPRLTR